MIKFFRTIRKQFISNGRITGYLLYAAGEIILVVIGILIALQINNWNEANKAKQLEQVYYCKLLEDVRQDQLLLEKLIEENGQRITSSNQMIALLQQQNPTRKAVVTEMRGATSKAPFTFTPSLAAFEDLKSSGNLSILNDIDLKNKLINYYATLDGFIRVVDANSEATVTMYNNPKKNFKEIGWQDIDFVRKQLDTTLVNVDGLKAVSFPSPQIREDLLSEAIFYLGINARKKELYQSMIAEILNMKKALGEKCAQP